MLLTTDWHPWFSYEWWNDIGVPTLGAVGSIAVGAGAIVVAYRSHNLAERVRGDEHKREADAARERYRDHLFRTVEPAMAALLDHRAEVARFRRTGARPAREAVANVMSRLNVVDAVANDEDRPMVSAVIATYEAAVDRKDLAVLEYVLGGLAFGLARLVSQARSIPDLVSTTNGLLDQAVAETSEKPHPEH
jgi:hypothetical protein